ncbi:MAG: hypothetical protein OEN23_14735 [Paracoccaceae bacterium]|nr:hypothetical protein [Paracoccaceae bacterium]
MGAVALDARVPDGMNAERRLAAILAADVVGYSRLMERDEGGTLSALAALRGEVVEPAIAAGHGRIVKLMGDGYLAEFASVVDAVESAIAIQTTLAEQTSNQPADRQILLRIGINLGDVVIEDGDIFGNGVNLAARLEAMAEPGTICLSGAVHDQVRHRIAGPFTDLGQRQVKNIEAPVQVFMLTPMAGAPAASQKKETGHGRDKPVVAVQPFTSLSSSDSETDFANGLSEDLLTALSRTRWFDTVAAPHGGADFLLAGSLRGASGKVRISVQLSDARSGTRVWADRYDRQSDDGFAVQDEIAQRIASVLTERVWQQVAREIGRKSPEDYSAHDLAYRGIEHLHRLDPKEIDQATRFLEGALAREPNLYLGHVGLGFCYLSSTFWGDPNDAKLDRALDHALASQALGPDNAQTYRLLSRIYQSKGQTEEAWSCVERALKINPNDGDIIGNRGVYHLFAGEFDQALEWIDKVLAMHEDTPHTVDIMHYWKALALFGAREYPACAAELGRITGLDFIKSELMAACLARLDRLDEARARAAEVLERYPGFRLRDLRIWRSFRRVEDGQHLRQALLDAGLPE